VSDTTPTLAEGLMETLEILKPVFEAAEGIKADMESRGWSPTAAEAVATEWLTGAMRASWGTR
jgi:hypothetical protein